MFILKKMKKANNIYEKALRNGVFLEATCVGIGMTEWERLMKNATRANKKTVHKTLKNEIESDFLKAYNPYNYFKTETHIIYVHSAIEHFFKIQ